MKHLHKSTQGAAFIELAFVLPLLLLLIFASVEMSRYIIIGQKVDKVAYTLADIITQATPGNETPPGPDALTRDELDRILANLNTLMAPYPRPNASTVVATSVRRDGNLPPRVKWQRAGGGTINDPDLRSDVNDIQINAITPAVKNMDAQFTPEIRNVMAGYGGMLPNENMIVVEVFYRFEPIYTRVLRGIGFDLLGSRTLHRTAFFRPRKGDLVVLPPDF